MLRLFIKDSYFYFFWAFLLDKMTMKNAPSCNVALLGSFIVLVSIILLYLLSGRCLTGGKGHESRTGSRPGLGTHPSSKNPTHFHWGNRGKQEYFFRYESSAVPYEEREYFPDQRTT